MEVRASFDVGSGSTKVQVCEVDVVNGKILNSYYGVERPLAFGVDFMKSSDGSISDIIQEQGITLFTELKQIAEHHGAIKFAAVATEVFRKAANGSDYIDKLKATTGISVTLVSQDMEAELGFLSVVAVSGRDPGDACVWDSGGASFQITTRDPACSTSGSFQLRAYLGALGTSISIAALIAEVRGLDMSSIDVKSKDVVNPVGSSEAAVLIDALIAKLSPVPDWLSGRAFVTSAGGRNSLFTLCCSILAIESCAPGNDPAATCTDVARKPHNHSEAVSEIDTFTLQDADRALSYCVDRGDDLLMKYQQFPHAEGSHAIVPKLALLIAVMRHTGIKVINNVPCVGSCAGVLTDPRFWS